MLSKNVETLKNMNGQIGKYAKWCARIVGPKVIPYEFKSKNEIVSAEKFECMLVSLDMLAYGRETHQALPVQQRQQDQHEQLEHEINGTGNNCNCGGGRANGSGDGSGATIGTERGE